MHFELRTCRALGITSIALATLLLASVRQLKAENPARPQPPAPEGEVSVQLPGTVEPFPQGEGSDIANSQCLLCHSVDMVLYQPPRTQAEWKATINKMRSAYGAPLPAEQVDELATYLSKLKVE